MKVAMSLVHLGNLRLPDNRASWNSAQPNYTESKVDCSWFLVYFVATDHIFSHKEKIKWTKVSLMCSNWMQSFQHRILSLHITVFICNKAVSWQNCTQVRLLFGSLVRYLFLFCGLQSGQWSQNSSRIIFFL